MRYPNSSDARSISQGNDRPEGRERNEGDSREQGGNFKRKVYSMEIKLFAKILYALSCVYGEEQGTNIFTNLLEFVDKQTLKTFILRQQETCQNTR